MGDGAGAAIVSTENLKCEFLTYHNETFGELYDHLVVDLMPIMHPELKEKAGVQLDMGNFFTVDEWFYKWMEREGKTFASNIIKKALDKVHLTFPDVDKIVIHQVDNTVQRWWMQGGEEIGINRNKWKETWNTRGNIGNVDIAANLVELWEQKEIKHGSIIALFAPGAGGHTPCMIIRWLV